MVQQLTTRAEEVSDEVDHLMSSISLLVPKEQNKILRCDRFAMTSFLCCFNSSVPTRVGPAIVDPLFPGNKCVLESSGGQTSLVGQTNCLVGSSWLQTTSIFPGDENSYGRCKDDSIEELWQDRICPTSWQKIGYCGMCRSGLDCLEKFNLNFKSVKLHISTSSPRQYLF